MPAAVNTRPRQRRQGSRGSSLIEVVVALLVLSVAIVGAAGAQIKAMKFGQVSQQRSLAVLHAGAIGERMRANLAASSQAASPYVFDVGYSDIPAQLLLITAPDCSAADCTAEQMAWRHLLDWQAHLSGGLTGGRGAIARTSAAAGAPYVVTVMWVEKEMVDAQRSLNCPTTAPADVQCVTLRFHP
ncbi:MAG: type IV pilus modification protein PilV [Rubrivivax sp.]